MTSATFDPRIIRLGIDIGGRIKVFEDLYIAAAGTKYASAQQNECEIRVANLSSADRDYLLTETSPFNTNRVPKSVTLEAGRQSMGVAQIYRGDIITCIPSQPPDTMLTLKCLTGQFQKGQIVSVSGNATSSLSELAQQCSDAFGLPLQFAATDKRVANYSFTGSLAEQTDSLNCFPDVDVFVDDNTFVVKDRNKPLPTIARLLNEQTGLIGIPQLTERGVKVTYLLDNTSQLGGALRVESKAYPTVTGNYIIYSLAFEVSNRDVPFYWIAECKRG
jgi:hypothetical protein